MGGAEKITIFGGGLAYSTADSFAMMMICADILKYWESCWQGAAIAGILSLLAFRPPKCDLRQKLIAYMVFFMDGVFFCYLSYVTLFSRVSGSRRVVIIVPFSGREILSGDFHYLIENVLLFVPYGILLCLTLHIYGMKCNMALILTAAFLTSFAIEILQYVFACGKSEAEDVIANSAGAMIGYAVYRGCRACYVNLHILKYFL